MAARQIREMTDNENMELRMLRAEFLAYKMEAQAILKQMEDALNVVVAKLTAEVEGGEVRELGNRRFALFSTNGKKKKAKK